MLNQIIGNQEKERSHIFIKMHKFNFVISKCSKNFTAYNELDYELNCLFISSLNLITSIFSYWISSIQ